MEKKTSNNSGIRTTHYLSNGEIKESMKDYQVPVNDRTIVAYQILARYAKTKE